MRKLSVVMILLTLIGFALPTAQAQSDGTIIDVARQAGNFDTLIAALESTGLDEELIGEGPFTVFAPTDEAFAALPEGTVEALLENPDILREILLYHVVAGNVQSADMLLLFDLETLNGETATINFEGNDILINEARVLTADILATNGVIHVIDRVLLPSGVILPEPRISTDSSSTTVTITEAGFYLRAAHLVPDAPAVDVWVDGEVVISELSYRNITSWVVLPAGTHTVAISASGSDATEALIGPSTLDFAADNFVTIAALGQLSDDSLQVQVLTEDYLTVGQDNARLTILHAVVGAPAVDVYLGNTLLFSGLQYGEFRSVELPATSGDLVLTASGDTNAVILQVGQNLGSHKAYFMMPVGSGDEIYFLVSSTNLNVLVTE